MALSLFLVVVARFPFLEVVECWLWVEVVRFLYREVGVHYSCSGVAVGVHDLVALAAIQQLCLPLLSLQLTHVPYTSYILFLNYLA